MADQPQQPKPRTSTDAQTEYNNFAFRAGNLQYEIDTKKKDLESINKQMRDLTLEFVSLRNKEAEVQKAVQDAAAAAKVAETPPAPPALAVVPTPVEGGASNA